MSAMSRQKIDLSKVAVSDKLTPCSIALVELIRTTEAIYGSDGLLSLSRDLTDEEDERCSRLEDRRSALETQIKREIREKLGVDWGILYEALA